MEIEEQVSVFYDKWEKIAKVALPYFPLLEPGERISEPEIRMRLRRVRKAGYDIDSLGGLGKKELWNYLMEVRRDIWKKAWENCPEVSREISAQNAEQRKRQEEIFENYDVRKRIH